MYAFAPHLQELAAARRHPKGGAGSHAALARGNRHKIVALRGSVAGSGFRAPVPTVWHRSCPSELRNISHSGGGRMQIMRGWVLMLVMASVLVALVQADAAHLKENARKHKIVYQLDDAGVDKAKFVLGNIRNHVTGVGGWQNIESLELVVFGPALKWFVQSSMDPALKQTLEMLQTHCMSFGACGNTMKNVGITLAELPRGSLPLPQGGVVRIMELQELGYNYLRP